MDSTMIAFLPTTSAWCKQDLPHMTLVYCGESSGLSQKDLNEILKDAVSVASMMGPFSLYTTGVEVFGEAPDLVDVIRLRPIPALLSARRMVEKWNKSQHKEFKPHATIGPYGSRELPIPDMLYFDQLVVQNGSETLSIRLGH